MNVGVRRVRRLLSLERPPMRPASSEYDATPTARALVEYASSLPSVRAR